MEINKNIYHKGKTLYIKINIPQSFLTITRAEIDKKRYDLEVILYDLFNSYRLSSVDYTAGLCINENISLKEWQEYKMRYKSMPLKWFHKEVEELVFQLERESESDIMFDLDTNEYD